MGSGLVVRCVALFTHPHRSEAIAAGRDLAGKLEAVGIRPLGTQAMVGTLGLADAGYSPTDLAEACQLAVAVGGDGTLLRAFHEVPSLPLVGVNCGKLGFLAEVALEECGLLAEEAAGGELQTVDRLALAAQVIGAEGGTARAETTQVALNDVALQKGPGRAPYLSTRVDGEELTTFLADSLVLSTPIGSTAYNFSARGPLLAPGVSAFVVTPVAPHSLWDRSLVLEAGAEVEIEVVGDRSAVVMVDGRDAGTLDAGAKVRVCAADEPARLVRWSRHGFTARVRRTFCLDP